jgi:predicted HicB family RNase H-like nuclease
MNKIRYPNCLPAEASVASLWLVRVPPDVRRELAVEAAEAGIGINCLSTVKLAH